MDENAELSAEVARLRKMEDRLERLKQENAKLQQDRRKLQAKNEEQEERLKSAGLDIERLQERYRAVMDEKVELAEQLAVSNSGMHNVVMLNLLS